jgi:hypothetical protein
MIEPSYVQLEAVIDVQTRPLLMMQALDPPTVVMKPSPGQGIDIIVPAVCGPLKKNVMVGFCDKAPPTFFMSRITGCAIL